MLFSPPFAFLHKSAGDMRWRMTRQDWRCKQDTIVRIPSPGRGSHLAREDGDLMGSNDLGHFGGSRRDHTGSKHDETMEYVFQVRLNRPVVISKDLLSPGQSKE